MRTLKLAATLAASMLVLAACGGEEEAPIDPAVQSPGIETPAPDAIQDPAADDPAAVDADADVVVTPVPDEAAD